jgi:non-specific serine/threonine protein kinase
VVPQPAASADGLTFGRWLQRSRKAIDLTQASLGHRVGCATVTIHKLERDQLRPSRELASLLADQLGIPAADRETFLRLARGSTTRQSREENADGRPNPDIAAVTLMLQHRNGLPIFATRFIGRETELAAGSALLALDHVRLLTLTGPGGIGKTRLGREIAVAVAERFRDGVCFVDLAPIADPELVVGTVASIFGLRGSPDASLLATLLGALYDRDLLLILDNCEHLIDACARLCEAVLETAPSVRVLATSRVALRIPGEVKRPVGPLALPPVDDTVAGAVHDYASARLFVERASAVQSTFSVTERNAYALVRICRRLDGIPLALELAAARTNVLDVQQIASRLDDRLGLLTSGSRTALPRHRTLRGTLDWSYELLHRRERQLFKRLAVFAGGCTLGGVERVAAFGEVAREDVLDSVAALVDHSLVVTRDMDGETRYVLLETLRQYAWDRLTQSGNVEQLQERHLQWCLELAAQADPERPGDGNHAGLRQLSAEHDNMRAAFAWSVEHQPPAALKLAGHLAEFWRRGGHHAEGRHALELVLTRVDPAAGDVESRARVLLGAGQLAADAGQFTPLEVERAHEAVRLFRVCGNEKALVDALQHLGRCILETGGSIDHVQQLFEESLRIAERRQDVHGIAFTRANVAYLTWKRGDHARALLQFSDAIEDTRASGDALFAGLLLGLVGWYLFEKGDLAGARATKNESLAILRDLEATEAVGLALLGLAHIEREAGNAVQMWACLEESADLLKTTGSPGLGDWMLFVGGVHVDAGEYIPGIQLLTAAGGFEGPRYGSMRFLLYQIQRSEAEARLATARTAVGELAFATASAAGRAMPWHEAVARALRWRVC